ncbi:MAG: hypothetical protein ABSE89_05445 [Sedimentisphaerales bacterium]
MTQNEQIQYLANIYYLARADNNFQVEEDYMLQDIAKAIGAGYLETRKALDLSMADDFKLKVPMRLSERIRNLEDMLMVAYYDKKLDEMEKKIITVFVKHLDITKEQFDTIQQEVKKRLQQKQNPESK